MQHVDEGERFIERAWPRKDPMVGNDPQKPLDTRLEMPNASSAWRTDSSQVRQEPCSGASSR